MLQKKYERGQNYVRNNLGIAAACGGNRIGTDHKRSTVSYTHLDVYKRQTISAERPGARRETLETYTSRLRQLEDITNNFKGVDKSFAIQAGREVRVMVVPEQISDADMVLLARDISKQIEAELEYPGQIKVNAVSYTHLLSRSTSSIR